MRAAAVARRATAAASRRLGRPELLAAVDATARQAQREELGMRAVLAATLRGDGTYVDVGANRGQVLRDALRIAPHARHIAFEPIPALCAELAREFPGVECRRLALGGARGVAQFCHFTQLDGWSGLRRSPLVSDERGRPEYIEVVVSTLDEELAGMSPSVLKIDVEGAELEALRGAVQLLRAATPVVIFEHVPQAAALYGAASQELWELLAGLGYDIFAITGEGPCTCAEFCRSTTTVNWLARASLRSSTAGD
jgi:FkbM family methyltransferase